MEAEKAAAAQFGEDGMEAVMEAERAASAQFDVDEIEAMVEAERAAQEQKAEMEDGSQFE